ncbi:MAG: hypothetical protein JETCAE02_02670 [Anaerolineaceae bacterium]|nr:DUF3800 domain-containing protein [Anaerolineae bacterium AMX1]NOG74783.1 DUF3800 domain-containing protein [Chloroflexota bacterium]WKZ54809.1 MAG: DUF3800 domain-containing protein [Anaerolineales bacterium]GJQ37855.1 MAG: hypothetical protein JETCAE02_02670 [Anaerolineaceae bacterium]GIK10178.1 MAG: hypothetical protein BroJett001_22440 [Chloroflexota bacterium]
MTSYIYVDWSGDPGFRFRRGSSDLLLVAAVSSRDREIDVSPLRQQLHLSDSFEFHYVKTADDIRRKFRHYITAELDFPLAIVLRIDKRRIPQEFRKMSGEQILANFIAQTIQVIPASLLDNSILLYDGKKEQRSFRNVLRRTLSMTLKSAAYLSEVKATPASKNDGLQTADMLAGLARTGNQLTPSKKVKIVDYPP